MMTVQFVVRMTYSSITLSVHQRCLCFCYSNWNYFITISCFQDM